MFGVICGKYRIRKIIRCDKRGGKWNDYCSWVLVRYVWQAVSILVRTVIRVTPPLRPSIGNRHIIAVIIMCHSRVFITTNTKGIVRIFEILIDIGKYKKGRLLNQQSTLFCSHNVYFISIHAVTVSLFSRVQVAVAVHWVQISLHQTPYLDRFLSRKSLIPLWLAHKYRSICH